MKIFIAACIILTTLFLFALLKNNKKVIHANFVGEWEVDADRTMRNYEDNPRYNIKNLNEFKVNGRIRIDKNGTYTYITDTEEDSALGTITFSSPSECHLQFIDEQIGISTSRFVLHENNCMSQEISFKLAGQEYEKPTFMTFYRRKK